MFKYVTSTRQLFFEIDNLIGELRDIKKSLNTRTKI